MAPDTEAVRYGRAEIDAYLAETDKELEIYVNPAQMTYLPVYLGRADAMHALGRPDQEVLRQLWMAGRCYADHGGIYLTKWPRHQFRRRRLLPLEAALAAGDAEVMNKVGQTFGLDAMELLARIEPDAVTHEVRVLSPHFHGGRIADEADLTGTLAVLYWLALSAVLRSDSQGFSTVMSLSAKILGEHPGKVATREGGLGRMLCVHQVLGNLAPLDAPLAVAGLAEHGRLFHDALVARAASDEAVFNTGAGSLDTTVIALLSIASALGVDLGEALRAAKSEAGLSVALAYMETLGHSLAA